MGVGNIINFTPDTYEINFMVKERIQFNITLEFHQYLIHVYK